MKKILFASLLVGGTAIGAGMLALPVVTAGGGILPTWFVYLLCWLFSMATGVLFVEVGLWLAPGANLVTMAQKLLGSGGRFCAWILYIFLFYTLTIAYVAGAGNLLALLFGFSVAQGWLTALFVILFGLFVFWGTRAVGPFNSLLMIGLVVCYFGFVFSTIRYAEPHLLEHFSFPRVVFALPVIFGSFSYQGVIPTLFTYLDRDARKMRAAVIIGSTIPFVSYVVWDFLIKAVVPVEGPHSLSEAAEKGWTAVDPLVYFLPGSGTYIFGKFFEFFALTTSFLGVTLGLIDFLADSLKIKHKRWNRFGLCILVYVPAFMISATNPTIFLRALSYAGGIGCPILLGLLPICMVWSGRYVKNKPRMEGRLFGGKLMLAFLGFFVLFEITLQIIQEFVLSF